MRLLRFSSEPTACQQLSSCEWKGATLWQPVLFLFALIVWFAEARTMTFITIYVSKGESCRMFPLLPCGLKNSNVVYVHTHLCPLSNSMSTEQHCIWQWLALPQWGCTTVFSFQCCTFSMPHWKVFTSLLLYSGEYSIGFKTTPLYHEAQVTIQGLLL